MISHLYKILMVALCIGLSQAQYGQYGLNHAQNPAAAAGAAGQYPGGLASNPANPDSRILGLLGGGGGGGLFGGLIGNLLGAFTGHRPGGYGGYPYPVPVPGYPPYGGFGGFGGYPGYGGFYG